MLKPRNIPDIVIGALLAVALFAMGAMFETLHGFPSNINASENSQSGGTIQTAERTPNITDWLLVVFNCLLVGSTGLLWKANNRSAKIAEQALTELERPVVTLEVLQLGLSITSNGTITSPASDFKYQLVNYGRTPATLTELLETWPIVDRTDHIGATTNLPEPIDPIAQRGRQFPAGVVVGQGAPYELRANALSVIDINRFAPTRRFHVVGNDLYFLGYVRYSDIFNKRYILGFCAVYDFIGGRFVLMGDERYNYTRQENA